MFLCTCEDGENKGAYSMVDNKGNKNAFVPVWDGKVACFHENVYLNPKNDMLKVTFFLE